MYNPRVSIIVVNWNGLEDTLECLESVLNLDYPNFEIIVVDNGSMDDSVSIIPRNFPKVNLIVNKKNLGFAGGSNVGIKYALEHNAQYIWLLNNDTIVDKNALNKMVIEAEKEKNIGIVGSKIYFYNDPKKIWFAGAKINWKKGISDHIGMGEIDNGQYNFINDVERVTGCSMLVKKDVCNKVGILDENYFLYVEEVDWCIRARKAGFKCLFIPSSIVYHKCYVSVKRVGNLSKVSNYYNTRNFLYLINKSFSSPIREIILFSVMFNKLKYEKGNLLKMFLSGLMSSSKLEPNESPVLFGIKDFLRKKMGAVDYF